MLLSWIGIVLKLIIGGKNSIVRFTTPLGFQQSCTHSCTIGNSLIKTKWLTNSLVAVIWIVIVVILEFLAFIILIVPVVIVIPIVFAQEFPTLRTSFPTVDELSISMGRTGIRDEFIIIGTSVTLQSSKAWETGSTISSIVSTFKIVGVIRLGKTPIGCFYSKSIAVTNFNKKCI